MRTLRLREWWESWVQDLHFAARQFRRSPGFIAITALTLALGIGATTAVFSVVNGVMLRALPYPGADQIVQLWELNAKGAQSQISDANFDDLAAQSRSFVALAEFASAGTLSVTGGVEPVRATGAFVSHGFFQVFGVRPALGRVFVPEEEQPGGRPVIVLSHRFWQQTFNGEPSAIGKALTIMNQVFIVVGVMPPVLDFPAGTDLWAPRELQPRYPSRTAHNWQAVGRLKLDVDLTGARLEVRSIAKRIKAEVGDATDMDDAALIPLRDQIIDGSKQPLLLLLVASAALLLIACTNVVTLLVARLTARQGEVALRLALGAARHRLVQQCLAESLTISLAGVVVGLLFAWVGVRLILLFQPGNLPRMQDVRLDATVLVFAIAIAVLAAVAMGLLTAWRATRGDLRAALSQSQRVQSGHGSSEPMRRALVVAQMALTLVLLVGTSLLARSFVRLLAEDPGFRRDHAVVLDVSVTGEGPTGLADRVRFYDALIERLRTIPGLAAVGGINAMPLSSDGTTNGLFLIMTQPNEQLQMSDFEKLARDPQRSGQAEFRVASGGYFAAMNIPLVRGRLFDDRDAAGAPHVAVISASLAKARWPDEDPIGKIIQFGNMDGDLRTFTVVGIVGDIRQWDLGGKPRPTFYAFYRQRPGQAGRLNVVMATRNDPAPVMASARRIVRELRADVPPRLRTIESIVAQSVAPRRFLLFLVGVFGGAALVLAALGVYSVVSYLVAQREREISIRVALGARRQDVVGMVLRQGAALALIGIAIGAVVSLGITRLMSDLLYGISPTDPLAFAGVMAGLTVVSGLASWIPARRAARLEAMDVLRQG